MMKVERYEGDEEDEEDLSLNEVVAALTCPSCLELATTPVVAACGAHTFCKACLVRWYRTTGRRPCPTCRHEAAAQPAAVAAESLSVHIAAGAIANEVRRVQGARVAAADARDRRRAAEAAAAAAAAAEEESRQRIERARAAAANLVAENARRTERARDAARRADEERARETALVARERRCCDRSARRCEVSSAPRVAAAVLVVLLGLSVIAGVRYATHPPPTVASPRAPPVLSAQPVRASAVPLALLARTPTTRAAVAGAALAGDAAPARPRVEARMSVVGDVVTGSAVRGIAAGRAAGISRGMCCAARRSVVVRGRGTERSVVAGYDAANASTVTRRDARHAAYDALIALTRRRP